VLAQDAAPAQTPAPAQQPTNPTQGSNQPAPAGQTPATPPTAPAAAPTWSIGGIDFSGTLDAYYSFNDNHPAESLTSGNQLYNFDQKANSFDLNMVKLTASHDPDPFGFRFDFGFGRAFDTIHASEQNPEAFRYIEQAYVSWKPKSAKGFEADFGDFVTSAGAEVIETKDNWNYSRSLLFSWAIPYYHFGLRTAMPIGAWSVGVQVVNGWNDITDNNSGKTIGVTAALTKKKFAWNNNYYVGPEKSYIGTSTGVTSNFANLSEKGNRNLFDTTLLLTPKDAFNAYINFDYGEDHIEEGGLVTPISVTTMGNPISFYYGPGHARWVGIAGAAHFQVSKHVALTPRAEWFNDADGFTTGTRQKLKEVTVTGEYKWDEGVLTRLEYRYDDSNAFFFYRGANPYAAKDQSTLTLGVVAFFGPKR
jgi:hypothetical protein